MTFQVIFQVEGTPVPKGRPRFARKGKFATQPNNRCLWYDQSLIPAEVKFPDFQAAKDFYTVDGSRKWSAGDDWFYDIVERVGV